MALKFKHYLTETLPNQLKTLNGDQEPNFGLMTAHHMVEHLIMTTKTFSKRSGEPSGEATKTQLYFKKFIDAGCPFEHRPKEGVTKESLKELKYENINQAIDALQKAAVAFYVQAEENPDFKCFHPMIGEFTIEESELFIGKHGEWHAFQFGVLEAYSI